MRMTSQAAACALGALVVASCTLLMPVAPQYTQGQASVESLSGVDGPTPDGPFLLSQGSFIDDPADGVVGGAKAVFETADGWRLRLERFGMPGLVPTVTLQMPADSAGVRMSIYGDVGVHCRADLQDLSAEAFSGTVACDHMLTDISGRHPDISAGITFTAEQ